MKCVNVFSLFFSFLHLLAAVGIGAVKIGRSESSYFFPTTNSRGSSMRKSPGINPASAKSVLRQSKPSPKSKKRGQTMHAAAFDDVKLYQKPKPSPLHPNKRVSSLSAPSSPNNIPKTSAKTSHSPHAKYEDEMGEESYSSQVLTPNKAQQSDNSSPYRRLTLMMSPREYNPVEYREYTEEEQLVLLAYVLLNLKTRILIEHSTTNEEAFDHDIAVNFFIEFEKIAEKIPEEAQHKYGQINDVLSRIKEKNFVEFGTEKVALQTATTELRKLQEYYSDTTDLMFESNTLFRLFMVDYVSYRCGEVYLMWREAKKQIIDYVLEGVTVELNKNIIRFFCKLELARTALTNAWGIIEITHEKTFEKTANEIEQLIFDLEQINHSISDRINFKQKDEIKQMISKNQLNTLFPRQLPDILEEMHKIAKIEGSMCTNVHVVIVYIFNSLSCAETEMDEMDKLLDKIDKQYRTKRTVELVKEAGNALELVRTNFINN